MLIFITQVLVLVVPSGGCYPHINNFQDLPCDLSPSEFSTNTCAYFFPPTAHPPLAKTDMFRLPQPPVI